MSYYLDVGELKRRLKLSMPVQITLPDILSGSDFTVNRADVMDLLLIDPTNLVFESQSVPALYMEMGKLQRCAKRAADDAATAYRRWKQVQAKHYRSQPDNAKLSQTALKAQTEEHYRTLPDYDQVANLESYYLNLSYLFGDCKEAFRLKAEMVKSNQNFIQGFERVEKLTQVPDENLYRDEGASTPTLEMDDDEAQLAALIAAENKQMAGASESTEVVEVADPPNGKPPKNKPPKRKPQKKSSRSTRTPARGKKGAAKKGKGK